MNRESQRADYSQPVERTHPERVQRHIRRSIVPSSRSLLATEAPASSDKSLTSWATIFKSVRARAVAMLQKVRPGTHQGRVLAKTKDQIRFLQTRWRSISSFQLTYTLILLTALLAIPLGLGISHHLTNQRYLLSTATKQLIGSPAPGLDAKLSYNKQAQAFQFNPNASKGLTGSSGADGDNGVKIGGQQYYGVNLAKAVSKGQTFTDTTTKLSFTIAPAFKALGGKHTDGHVVYPFSKGQVVYTLKDNGLREDVVLPKPVTNLSLDYKLTLPDTLTARIEPNGALGIYSADPALFGNISYGGSSDQAAVQKARTNAKKTNLVFLLPAPTIAQTPSKQGSTNSNTNPSTAKTHFSLKGNTLTILADGLKHLHYPISIDPSVVVQSANSFTNGNNEDGNASIVTSSVTRGTLTGGGISGGWTLTGSAMTTGAWAQPGDSTLVVNGILYFFASSTNKILYATVGSGGSLGAWSTATAAAMPSGSGGQRYATYNGYMYEFGAYSGSGGSLATINAEYYAKISSNGDIPGWTALQGNSPVWGARADVGTTIYNGYAIVSGGCTSAPKGLSGNCNSMGNDTWTAPINADGTIGTWSSQTTTGYPSNILGQSVVAYNGYLYLLSACVVNVGAGFNNCDSWLSNVYYASISASGVVSAWQTTSSLNVGREGAVSIYNGYIYAFPGCTSQNCNFSSGVGSNDIEYAPIYANGALGVWTKGAMTVSGGGSSPSRLREGGVAYNGYLYQIGGCINTSGQCGNGQNPVTDSISAKIDTVGMTGDYAATGTGINSAGAGVYDTQTNARSWPSVVAYGGYLYIIGGLNVTAGTYFSTILYAPINTDGSVGTWQTATKSLNVGRSGAAAVVANGYLYVMGGNKDGTSTGYVADTEWAPIGASGNITTAFTDDTTHLFTTARQFLGAVAYNGYLYIVGGRYNNNSNSLADLQYAQLSTTGGLVANGISGCSGGAATWCATTQSLLTPEALPAVTTSGGYIYVIGGNKASSSDNTVYYSKFDTTGDITTAFGSAPTLPTGRYGAGASASNGFIYVVSGNGGSNLTDSLYAAVCTGTNTTTQFTTNCNGSSTPGTTSSWNSGPTLSHVGYGLSAVTYNGYIYTVGGCASQGILSFQCSSSTNTYNNVQYAPLNNGGGGTSGSWSTTTAMPAGRLGHGSVVLNGYVYVIGGCTQALSCLGANNSPNVYHAPLNADGTVGTWVTDTALPDGRSGAGIATYNGVIYLLGGFLASGSSTDNGGVYTTPNPSTGNITSWTATTTFSVGRQYLAATAYNGYVYIGGGKQASTNTLCNTVSSSNCNDIQYAPINANGSLGAWHFTHNSTDDGTTYAGGFATARTEFNMVTNNGYLYVLGGEINPNAFNDVQYAPLNSNGTVGAWNATSSFPRARYGGNASTYNGYMYLYNGEPSGGGTVNDIEYAPIFSNGTIGNWQVAASTNASSLPYAGGVVANGYLYSLGGYATPGSTTVSYAPLQTQPRTAHYSYLVDLKSTSNGTVGGDPQITRVGAGYTAASANSGVSACLQGATTAAPSNNNSFGSATCFTNPGSKTPQTWKSYGRYAFVYVTLDDSQSATYPDAAQSSLTELDTYFHAAPARRLRMGQTFTDMGNSAGTNNQLDVEGP